MIQGCPRALAERAANPVVHMEVASQVEIVSLREPQVQEEGFIPVKGPHRGVPTSSQQTTSVAKKSNGEMNGTNRVNSSRKESENIVLSNKYGKLDMGMGLDGVEEERNFGHEDKENLNLNVQKSKEKAVMTFGSKTSAPTVLKIGNKERGPGNKKVMDGVRGKPKGVNSRPVRGLVFGPTKGEISLSESGKRLRVENSEAGRYSGVFRERTEVGSNLPARLQLRDEVVDNPMESSTSEIRQGGASIQMISQEEERVVSLA